MNQEFEKYAHYLIAKDPNDNAVLLRATEDGKLLVSGSGGGGSDVNSFSVIGGISATKPGDVLVFTAGEGIQIIPDQATGTLTFAVTGGGSGGDVPDGSLEIKGIVRLSSTPGEDQTTAATPYLVTLMGAYGVEAREIAETDATTEIKGRVLLYANLDLDSDEVAATAGAIFRLFDYVKSHVIEHAESHLPNGSDPLPIAEVGKYGLTKLSSATDSDALDVAANSYAVQKTMDVAKRIAAIGKVGQTSLGSDLDSDSEEIAATLLAIKQVHEIASQMASLTDAGRVKLSKDLNQDSDEIAATASAISQLNTIATRVASSTTPGQVKVDSAVNSEATEIAASSYAVKIAYDKGVEGVQAASKAQSAATGAAEAASNAQSTASNAQSTATGAAEAAQSATTIANNAKTAAATAQSTANVFFGNSSFLAVFVDGLTGNDSNPGTQALPYKTPQYAVDQIAARTGRRTVQGVSLYIKGGQEYSGALRVSGFIGSGEISISRWVLESDPVFTGNIMIEYNSCRVSLARVTTKANYILRSNTYVLVSATTINTENYNMDGFTVESGGFAYISNCNIIGRRRGISNTSAKVISSGNTGTCQIGLYAALAGEIVKISTQPYGTQVPEQTDTGGSIHS